MIDETDFIARVETIFREELEQSDLRVSMQTAATDLENWDSLAHIRLVVAVERAFDVQLDVSEIESIDSVRDFYDAVKRRTA